MLILQKYYLALLAVPSLGATTQQLLPQQPSPGMQMLAQRLLEVYRRHNEAAPIDSGTVGNWGFARGSGSAASASASARLTATCP